MRYFKLVLDINNQTSTDELRIECYEDVNKIDDNTVKVDGNTLKLPRTFRILDIIEITQDEFLGITKSQRRNGIPEFSDKDFERFDNIIKARKSYN